MDNKLPAVTETNYGVNNPEVTVEGSSLKVGRRAVSSDDQAWQCYWNLKHNQEKRNIVNAKIAERYTGKRPRDPSTLKNEGRSWQSNFPTGMLEGIINRIVPNFLNAVEQQQYLTQAKLPDQIDGKDVVDKDSKENIFRDVFTRKVKSWREWRNFNAALATELVLIGYLYTLYTDEDTPWPMFARQDQAWVHEGSPQFADYLQTFSYEQPILINQLIKLVKNRTADDGSGWRLENVAAALNNAMPLDRTQGRKNADTTQIRAFVDLIRESSTADSFVAGAKGIYLGHLYVIEPDEEKGKGNVTHYMLDVATKKVLFSRERRFDTMGDVVTLFTLEPGNNKFYGSKGVGRMLANLSIGVDELVNDAVSQMKMSGMMVIKTDSSKTAINANIKVRAPFAIVNADGTLEKEQFPTDIEGFVSLYEQLTKIAEVAVGAYIPNVLASDPSQGRRTARESTIDYSRELQSQSAYIARFVGQYQGEMLHKVQKRLGKRDSTDDDAKSFRAELLEKKLSDKEIDLLCESPAVESISDSSSQQAQSIAMLATELAGNPMIDQKKVLEAKIVNQASPDIAKDWILTDAEDQTIQAEAISKQLLECVAMEDGTPMPVSPRDAHEIHLKTQIGKLQPVLQGLVGAIGEDPSQIDPKDLDALNLNLAHGEAHIQYMQKGGIKDEELKTATAFFKFLDKVITKAAQAQQEQAAQAQDVLQKQHDIMLRDHLGMPQPGAPGQGDPSQDNSGLPEGVTPQTLQGMPPGTPPHMAKIALSITYKDAPPHIQRQIEKAAGFDTTGLPDEASQPTTPPPTSTIPPAQTTGAQAPSTVVPPAQAGTQPKV
jgi:hypothetical protein